MAVIFDIDVLVFRAIGSLTTTTVAMTLVGGEKKAGEEGSVHPSGVRLIGNYMIRVDPFVQGGNPDDPTREMEVKFRLNTPGYLLQGIAFANRDHTSMANNLGQKNFTKITIGAEDNSPNARRVLAVSNSRSIGVKQSYDYLILIQKIQTGEIGIIDPEWENE
jgi:hypothetical protein